MDIQYKTKGTCSHQINLVVQDGIVMDATIMGGCHGNGQGVAALVKGMKVDDVIARCEGIQCRNGTSCPDQLAQALKSIK